MKPTFAVVGLVVFLGAGETGLAESTQAGDVGAIALPAGAAAYTSDVGAGAAIGIATNLAFTHPREHVSVALDASRGHAGCSFALAW